MNKPVCWMLLAGALVLPARMEAVETVRLQDLDLSKMRQGFSPQLIGRLAFEKPLSTGIETNAAVSNHTSSVLMLDLGGGSDRFLASVGPDPKRKKATATFQVYADGRKLWDSGVLAATNLPRKLELELKGAKRLLLVAKGSPNSFRNDRLDWGDAQLLVSGAAPRTVEIVPEERVILTPKPGPEPRINGPKVIGARPGNPFLFRIPTTGRRPMEFSAKGLPAGLTLDASTGIISGTTPPRGEYVLTLKARNAVGKAERALKIVSGETLALTPTMGWNHWYAHYNRVTDQMMREATDVMVRSGMADVGYAYVDIDDCWMNASTEVRRNPDALRFGPMRDAQGNIVPNKHFPDMKALTDYIHRKGLKAGIYTSPGPLTCGGYYGSYQHEAQDAKQFAEWGFDLLKYDWCSYRTVASKPPSLEEMQRPYRLMGGLLKQQPRDIVFNLCQYGMGEVWKWGAEVGGHSWRTAGDLGFSLDRIFTVALKNAGYGSWQKPGAWNDPDYIQIGYIGVARGHGLPEPCPLTPSEQYAFMSLWCLMASPLVFSGDMNQLDDFTLNVLCNPELIEVNQDPLGECGTVVQQTDETFLLVKRLEDGSKAVGLCNGGEVETTVTASWKEIGIKGKRPVRDLWRQQDLGAYKDAFSANVPRHGVVVVRVGK